MSYYTYFNDDIPSRTNTNSRVKFRHVPPPDTGTGTMVLMVIWYYGINGTMVLMVIWYYGINGTMVLMVIWY